MNPRNSVFGISISFFITAGVAVAQSECGVCVGFIRFRSHSRMRLMT